MTGEAHLRDLVLPRPFSVPALCEAVARHRGRPLRLLPLPEPASESSPYGAWVQTGTADFILHEQDTSSTHRDQIVLHEIAHMLLGHEADAVMDAGTARRVLPDLDPAAVSLMLSRHAYSSAEERQAEMLASLILERSTDDLSPPAAADDVLGRLGDALRHPIRGRRA